jgi:hypothetical protein
MHHGAGDGEPLHHAAGKSAYHLIRAVGQLKFFQQLAGALVAILSTDPEIRAVEGEDFTGGQRKIEIRTLRDDSDQPFDDSLIFPDIVVAEPAW